VSVLAAPGVVVWRQQQPRDVLHVVNVLSAKLQSTKPTTQRKYSILVKAPPAVRAQAEFWQTCEVSFDIDQLCLYCHHRT
jgi:hypothetical protein